MKGEVEGSFPSSFTLHLYEPPSAGALMPKMGGESDVAFGGIAAIAPDHPAWLRENADTDGSQHAKLCDNTGQCLKPQR